MNKNFFTYIAIVILLILANLSYCQSFVIIQIKDNVCQYNVDSNESIDMFKLPINSSLIGYRFYGNEIIFYFEKFGVVDSTPFDKSLIYFSNSEISSETYLSKDGETVFYEFDSLKFSVENGHTLCYIRDDVKIWEKKYISKGFPGIGMSGVGYQIPIISNNKKFIVVQKKLPGKLFKKPNTVIEKINILTGEVKVICKDCSHPIILPDNNTVLFYSGSDKNYISIYKIENNKIENKYNWKKAIRIQEYN